MKIIKSVLLGSSLLMLTASVFAQVPIGGDYHQYQDSKIIKTVSVATKAEAYSLGLEELTLLKSESGSALSADLSLSAVTPKEKNSVKLNNGAYITIQESMNAQGDIVYTGLVNVTYHYYRKDWT